MANECERKDNFPWDVQELDQQQTARIKSFFAGYSDPDDSFVRVGPKGYLYPSKYKQVASRYYNMPIRPTDIFVMSFPRSGTTLTQELVWLVANDLDYEKSAAVLLIFRCPNLDLSHMVKRSGRTDYPELPERYRKNKQLLWSILDAIEHLSTAIDPRFIKTHLPLTLMPPNILEKSKIVYVARDPRDVAVSLYHFSRSMTLFKYRGDFKTFWSLFVSDLVRGPYFAHLKEAWEQRHHHNMLFIFYEDMIKDLPSVVQRVAIFFNKQYSEEQITCLCEHLSIENFKKVQSIMTDDLLNGIGYMEAGEQPTIRQGKSGKWRNYFDEEMLEQAEQWMADNLRDTDLRFPDVN